MKKNEKKLIPLRTTLTADIFNEMEAKYPPVSDKGIEYKQTISIIGIPVDFDFNEMYDFAADSSIDPAHAIAVLLVLLTKMGETCGFYFIAHRRTAQEIAFLLGLDGSEIQKILDFLIEFSYIYNFDNRITSTIAVRSYEILQSSRAQNRMRKSKPVEELEEPKVEPQKEETSEIAPPLINMEEFNKIPSDVALF